MRNSNTNYTNVTLNLFQSLFNFNKLDHGETCQGLRHWRLLSNLKNNFSKPVRNDMKKKSRFLYFPISFSLKKLRRFRIKSGMTFMKQSAFTLAEGATHVDLSPTKVKFAFTLAEVLITLGIIGVVAALTIPGLITKYHRHVVETKLVKFDSIINQAVRMSIAENDDLVFTPPEDGVDKAKYLKEWFDENLMKYIKGDYDGGVIRNRYYKIIFHDGTGFVAYIPNAGSNIFFFYCLEAKDKSCKLESFDGKNTFLFTYAPRQKAVLPGNYDVTDVNKLKYGFGQDKGGAGGCYQTTRTDRHMCTQLIKQNGWKIPDDYPWIK